MEAHDVQGAVPATAAAVPPAPVTGGAAAPRDSLYSVVTATFATVPFGLQLEAFSGGVFVVDAAPGPQDRDVRPNDILVRINGTLVRGRSLDDVLRVWKSGRRSCVCVCVCACVCVAVCGCVWLCVCLSQRLAYN